MYSIALDTNVFISALRSRRGASFAILRQIGESWVPLISVPLILEYEAVGKREAARLQIARAPSRRSSAHSASPAARPTFTSGSGHFSGPGDEFLLELAVAGRADAIVTHNVRHFAARSGLASG